MMVKLYELTDFNPEGVFNEKTQIILTETRREYSRYIKSLKYRYNKKNPYLPNYVVTKTGDIYKIMEPECYSKYMENPDYDKPSIIISLENMGWLKKNPLEMTYLNWVGDIYKKEVFEKKWREQIFWDKYNETQIISLSKLILELCDKFDIPKQCLGTNVKWENVEYFKGIVSRSNFNNIYKDVNPSFNFKLLKKLIEDEQPI
jgi:hypothetical protein